MLRIVINNDRLIRALLEAGRMSEDAYWALVHRVGPGYIDPWFQARARRHEKASTSVGAFDSDV